MDSFNELGLDPKVLRAIADLGFEKPSPIQAEALPILTGEPTDFIGLAATGTGKTAAFTIPFLGSIDTKLKKPQVLIMCPTRELSLQVSGQVDLLGKYMGVKSMAIYGGAGYQDQFRGLKQGIPVVVGTPGRMIDHLERGSLDLSSVKIVVLDEADEMISMGFKEDMETILEGVPRDESHIWLFSATMSRDVRKVADEFLKNPKSVQINRKEMLSSTVEQIYYMTQESNKPEVLCKLIDMADDFYGVIFCQTKALVTDLTRYMSERGYKTDCLHGDMTQSAREKTMALFRDKRLQILICTDVASRGLDVKGITHVINYSLPRELDSYVHRIGRTARSGKTGIAMSLVTHSHRMLIGRIEQKTGSRMQEGVIPGRKEIGQKKIAQLLPRLMEQKSADRAAELLNDGWREALASMTTEELAGRFLNLMYPEVFAMEKKPAMQRQPRAEDGARGDSRRFDRRDERRDERRDDRRGDRREDRRDDRREPAREFRRDTRPQPRGRDFEFDDEPQTSIGDAARARLRKSEAHKTEVPKDDFDTEFTPPNKPAQAAAPARSMERPASRPERQDFPRRESPARKEFKTKRYENDRSTTGRSYGAPRDRYATPGDRPARSYDRADSRPKREGSFFDRRESSRPDADGGTGRPRLKRTSATTRYARGTSNKRG